jgi:hypothetical protein
MCVRVCMCVCAGAPVCSYSCINARILDCPAFDQYGIRMKKLAMSGPVQYQTKFTQSDIFLVRYQTEI